MLEIGIIVKPQGIRGDLRVYPTTDNPSYFKRLIGKKLNVQLGSNQYIFTLLQARMHKKLLIVKFENINDRDTAQSLVRGIITISEDMALPLEKDEYFVRDLVGLQVYDDKGTYIGKINRVLNTNANDVYVIEADPDDFFMIPAIKSVVMHISIPDNKMIINLLDGLRDLKYTPPKGGGQ